MPRFVVCLTTIPERLDKVEKVVKTYLNQLSPPDVIYVTIPLVCKSGKLYDENIVKQIGGIHPIIRVLRPPIDHGPIMKFYNVLSHEKERETKLLIVDDDKYAKIGLISLFKKYSKKYPNHALSLTGWIFGKFPFYFENGKNRGVDTRVDWLQGTDCILVKREWFEQESLLNYEACEGVSELFRKNDDHWIAYHLHRKNVPLTVIGKDPDCFLKISDYSRENAISGQTLFFWGVFRVGMYLREKGYYSTSVTMVKSVTFRFILFTIILIFFIRKLLTRKQST